MQLDKSYIEAFRNGFDIKINKDTKGPFRERLKNNSWNFDVDDKKLFIDAVYQGYLDASRTFAGISKVKQSDKERIFNELAKNIQEYFQNEKNIKSFDELHNKWCMSFLESLNSQGYKAKYGQSQKIVNMAFKYLYCGNGAEKYEKYFKPCHMPLDSFILDWFATNIETPKGKKSDKKIGKWSKIEYSDIDKNEINGNFTYNYYLQEIREFFKNNDLTPLQAEFIIWPKTQFLLAAESFLKELKNNFIDTIDNYETTIRPNEVHEKLKEIQKEIENQLK